MTSAQTQGKKDKQAIAREIDKKKKKHLMKTFLKQGLRKPFCAPIGQIVHISTKTCEHLGIAKEHAQ
jgi:hypothetical protein